MNTVHESFEFFLSLERAVIRYQEVRDICTASGCGCPNCSHIENARAAIASAVLHHAGLIRGFEEAPLPGPFKKIIQEKRKSSMHIGFVYLMQNRRNGLIKVGFSKRPEYREGCLQSEEPEIRLLFSFPGTLALEKCLHLKLSKHRVRGEWFCLDSRQIEEIQNEYVQQ